MSSEYIEKKYSYKAVCPICNIMSTKTSKVRGILNSFKRDVFGNPKTEYDLRQELELKAEELSKEKDGSKEVCKSCDNRRSSRDMKYIYKSHGVKDFQLTESDFQKYTYLEEKGFIKTENSGRDNILTVKITEKGINFIKSFDIDFISV